jgi:hypothetical protein
MTHRTIVLLLTFCLASGVGWAQSGSLPDPVSVTLEQVTPDVDPRFAATEIGRTQLSFQKGRSPDWPDGDSRFENAAQITQIGDRNLTILRQYGRQNIASLRLEGSENVVDVAQEGYGNLLGVSVLGSGNQIPVSQIGVGNDLTLELLNVDDFILPAPGIQQVGTGVPLLIRITPNHP